MTKPRHCPLCLMYGQHIDITVRKVRLAHDKAAHPEEPRGTINKGRTGHVPTHFKKYRYGMGLKR